MMKSTSSASGSKRRKKEVKASRGGLTLGYEVLEIRDEGDEGGSLAGHDWLAVGLGVMLIVAESAPPLSVYYPPSSHKSFTKLVPTALPPKSISVGLSIMGRRAKLIVQETAIMIVLDWTKPSSMVRACIPLTLARYTRIPTDG
jgi:dynein light intermediate chain 1